MLRKVISGGQVGADLGGLRAARRRGIETGGYAPLGWQTERGPDPSLADYGLVECKTPGYPARTEANVAAADGTVWFGGTDSPGYRLTKSCCERYARPFFLVVRGVTTPACLRRWIEDWHIEVLCVAGNRESKMPGIGAKVEAFLVRVFTPVAAGKEVS